MRREGRRTREEKVGGEGGKEEGGKGG